MKSFAILKNVLFVCSTTPLLLCGCNKKQTDTSFSPQLDECFTVTAEMTYGDRESEAELQLTRNDTGIWEAEFQAPSSLAGVVLNFEDNAVSASYKGLSFTVPKSALPAKTMLLITTDVLDSLSSMDTLPCEKTDDDTWKISGECESGSYTVTFTESGQLCTFEMPNQPLLLTFSDFTVSAPMQTDTTGETSCTTETTISSTEPTETSST